MADTTAVLSGALPVPNQTPKLVEVNAQPFDLRRFL